MNEPCTPLTVILNFKTLGTWIELKQLSGWKEAEKELLAGRRIGPRPPGGN